MQGPPTSTMSGSIANHVLLSRKQLDALQTVGRPPVAAPGWPPAL